MNDAREWLSFDDPEEERTWMFDVTFLGSGYACIYGRGCQGIGAQADETLGCCEHGAYLSDDNDYRQVSAAVADYLGPDNWQLACDDPFETIEPEPDPDEIHPAEPKAASRKTRTVDGACVFLNREDFDTGPGCALHTAALEHGISPHEMKPEVCWQVPVRREDHETETGHIYSMVREWARRDWGEGGHDFGWWCTNDPVALAHPEPAYESLRPELIAICGEAVYEAFAQTMRERDSTLMWPQRRST